MVGHPTEAAKARGRSHGTTGICLLNGFSVSIVTLKIIVTSVRSLTLSVITRDFRTLCSGTSQFPRCAWRIPIPIPSSASASASPPQRSLPRVLCVASFPFISGHIIIPGLVCQALPHSTTIPQGWWHIAAHFVCSTPTPSSYDNRIPLFLEGTRPPLSSLFAVELLLLPRLQGGCTTQARPICTIHPPGQWDWLRWRWPYIRLAQNQSCNRCRS